MSSRETFIDLKEDIRPSDEAIEDLRSRLHSEVDCALQSLQKRLHDSESYVGSISVNAKFDVLLRSQDLLTFSEQTSKYLDRLREALLKEKKAGCRWNGKEYNRTFWNTLGVLLDAMEEGRPLSTAEIAHRARTNESTVLISQLDNVARCLRLLGEFHLAGGSTKKEGHWIEAGKEKE